MQAGKLETYLLNFINQLNPEIQKLIKEISVAANIEGQKKLFQELVKKSGFKEQFISYFDKENLGMVRDPKLFKYVGDGVGETFFQSLERQCETVLWRDNFYWKFFFFGTEHLSEDVLPPCYREENYQYLKTQVYKLEIKEGEIIDYLLSDNGQNITKASLSNVFEYASPTEFKDVIQNMRDLKRKCDLRLVYWNLLQHQAPPFNRKKMISSLITENDKSCFYFKNTYQIQFYKQ
jgi:S-adenosylmethionine-diacylglycerol 3-amino-3-carboxypropyl transferase